MEHRGALGMQHVFPLLTQPLSLQQQDAIELGQRAIYHATFRDAASGGTASVYHVTASGWKKVRGDDVLDLHTKYYPKPELHPTNAVEVL